MLLNLDAGCYRVVCVPSTGCKHPHLVALVVSLDHRLQTNAPTPFCLLPSNKTPCNSYENVYKHRRGLSRYYYNTVDLRNISVKECFVIKKFFRQAPLLLCGI